MAFVEAERSAFGGKTISFSFSAQTFANQRAENMGAPSCADLVWDERRKRTALLERLAALPEHLRLGVRGKFDEAERRKGAICKAAHFYVHTLRSERVNSQRDSRARLLPHTVQRRTHAPPANAEAHRRCAVPWHRPAE